MNRILFREVLFRYAPASRPVLDRVSTELPAGSVTFLLGNSGGGKSSFLKLAAGLLQPDAGDVMIGSLNTRKASKPQLIAFHRQSAFSFQDAGLISNNTLYDNLALPLRYHTSASEQEIREKIDPLLAELGLEEDRANFPSQLSRSERKLAGIARCLLTDPELFFFDEPLAGLDYVAADRVKKILSLLASRKKTLVATDQSLSFAMRIADRIIVLVDGHIVFDDAPGRLDTSEHSFIRRLLAGRRETTSFYSSLEQNTSPPQEPPHGL